MHTILALSNSFILVIADKEEQPPQQVHDPPSPDSKNNSDQAAGTKPDSNTETGTPDAEHGPPTPAGTFAIPDEDIASLVDMALNSFDQNEDGYVEYFEYKKARKM